MRRALLLAVLVPFSLLSAWALMEVGYLGIWRGQMHPGGWQVLADLVVMAGFVIVWMWQDAKATGRNPWPFIAITLPFGSFGPLLYWLLAPAARRMG